MSRETILQIAKAELGTTENPRNSNKTKYGAWYGLDAQPWCAMFVSWVYDQAHNPLGRVEGNKGYASCQGGYNFWKAAGRIVRKPQPGDIVLYDWKGDGHCDHTGIFESWVKEGSSFQAYEGNTSVDDDSNGGIVMLRKRTVSTVKAFVSPAALDGEAAAPETFDPTLRRGDGGARVVRLQKMLFDLQYDIVVDGDFGAQTERALKRFQTENGLPNDGIASPAVAGAIDAALQKKEAPDNKLTQGTFLKKGSAGVTVLNMQKALNKKLGAGSVSEDGVFGNDTAMVLKSFQAQQGLTADAIAGPATFKALGMRNA